LTYYSQPTWGANPTFDSNDPASSAGMFFETFTMFDQGPLSPRVSLTDLLLKKASDFSAGAGDVLSFGTTYLARKYIFDSDKVVDKGSGAYITGAVTGAALGAALGKAGVSPGGFLNSNRYLRIGFSRLGGNRVFRIGGQVIEKLFDQKAIDIFKGGPL